MILSYTIYIPIKFKEKLRTFFFASGQMDPGTTRY